VCFHDGDASSLWLVYTTAKRVDFASLGPPLIGCDSEVFFNSEVCREDLGSRAASDGGVGVWSTELDFSYRTFWEC
jgi:hypothetical protein